MNKEQAKGVAKEAIGKIQEEIGKLIGSKTQQAHGLEKQVDGKFEETIGDLRKAIQELKQGRQ
jgi:uncharacterized protein YjbJ (UPF0337 family)